MKKFSKPLKVISRIGNKRITYFVIKREIKYPRLEFKNNLLYLIIPKKLKDFKNLIKKKEKWILKKRELIDGFLEKSKGTTNKFMIFGIPTEPYNLELNFLNRTKPSREIKNILKQMLFQKIKRTAEKYSQKLDITYNKILIRNQKTKWASCSSKKNLSFNIKILSLPEVLINYLVFHEMLHLVERNHNENFVSVIKKEFPNFNEIEKELTKYWFILNKNKIWRRILSN